MRRLLLHALLALLPAAAFADETTILLWVPSESFSDWAAVSRALEEYPDLRLTIGLTPEMAGQQSAAVLKPWIEGGRLEAALRIDGDPLLPIIALEGAAPRPQDAVNRLALARELFRLTLTSALPSGFIPAGGVFSPELMPAYKAMGLSWVAAGGAAELRSWDSPVVVSFHPPVPGSPALPEEALLARGSDGTAALIVDEASGLTEPGSMLRQFAFLAKERPRQKWMTVSQALSSATRQAPVLQPSAWNREAFTGAPAQDKAWAAYHQAAAAVKRYQNSGSADLKALEEAAKALYAAQDSSLYRRLALPLEAAAADEKLRALLMRVYRTMNASVPGSLFLSEETSTDLAVSQTPTSLTFENPKNSEPGRLQGLAISWTDEDITFAYRLTADTAGLAAVRLDTYIDLNGRPGAGSTSLLEGRNAYAQNRDAWEFALEVSGGGARLLRSSPAAAPSETARCVVSLNEDRSEVHVTVSRSKLPGNPLRWGYIAFPLAPGGSAPLNVLGPLDFQKAAAQGGRRLSAVSAAAGRR
jgi:hypothetical protein